MSEVPESRFSMSDIPESVFQMSEIPGSVCRKVGISGIGYVRFRKFLFMVWKQRTFGLNDPKVQQTAQTYFAKKRLSYLLHMGIPRSARVGPEIPSFDCMGSGIPNSEWITAGIPDSDPMVSGIPSPEPKVSGIPNLDLRIPESY